MAALQFVNVISIEHTHYTIVTNIASYNIDWDDMAHNISQHTGIQCEDVNVNTLIFTGNNAIEICQYLNDNGINASIP